MLTIKNHLKLTAFLGLLTLLGMGFSHLALTDIYHGEPNPLTEWSVVQVSFLVFFLLAVSSLALAWRLRKQA